MINRKNLLYSALACSMLYSASAGAAVSAQEAAKLGDTLTPMGAEKSGNGDEIPAWDGGLLQAPGAYQGDGRYVDPFPKDKELFRIDQSNVDQYADNLTPGQIAMIRTYDDYFMPVYQTRRTATYPADVLEKTKANATEVELVESGNGLKNYKTATPFPIPQNGLEVIFNHITRYRGGSFTRNVAQVTPQPNGDFSPVRFTESFTERVALEDFDPSEDPNVMFYFKQAITAPSRLAGNVLLVHETIDQVKEPRRSWIYNAGQRRVRRAPQVSYDGPGTAADGLRTSDNFDMYNGAPNQYDWELKGKREIFVPYNAYKLHDADVQPDDVIRPQHINQELARYELHRVWVVEAKLRTGISHIYSRRVFYVDEDSWQILATEEYDSNDELWRVSEAHNISYYSEPVFWTTMEMTYDLNAQRYYIDGLDNGFPAYDFEPGFRGNQFSASAARRAARR